MAQTTDSHRARGEAFFTAGDWRAAIDALQQAITAEPQAADLLVKLGRAYLNLGQTLEAVQYLKLAHQAEPTSSHTLAHLAVAISMSEGRSAALPHFAKAAELAPTDTNAQNNYGQALLALDRLEEAEPVFRQALQHDSKHVQALTGLASIMASRDTNQAERLFRQVLQIQPNYPEALLQLGYLFLRAGHAIKALSFFENASHMPGDIRATVNVASALCHLGWFAEARIKFAAAQQEQPSNTTLRSVRLLSSNYDPDLSREELFRWHQEFGSLFPVHLAAPDRSSSTSPKHKIRLGYVSGDYRSHVCAWFLLPLIQAHNREKFEIVCYSTDAREDAVTQRFWGLADKFRPIATLDDTSASRLIAEDQIDVLIDCSGHSNGNRLALFAMKPAPVSVSFLGYPNTTGLRAIDFRFTDSISDPLSEGNTYSTETLVRLPNGFSTYAPTIETPKVSQLPCIKRGTVTFASFNNRLKLNDRVIAVWARILKGTRGSRLLLKDRCFSFPAMVEDLRERFQTHGVPPDSLDIRPYDATVIDHFRVFAEVDISLDPFPYNGTTSTCDALWMGVPVIALRGDRQASRMGASLLTRVGYSELVAENSEDYVRIA
ncbi:MAG: tetratricopeptide repeat protein, partial [Rhodospirillaceae bacterium]|nr:tetratricopeptide repeat protein [Rhodospirillaceae bacterium]